MGGAVSVAHFAVVILAYAQDRMGRANRDVLRTWSDSRGRCAATVMVCPTPLLGQAQAWLGRGVDRVVGIEAIAGELRGTVAALLEVAPRLRVRAPILLTPVAAPTATPTTGRTENISESGMLVSCADQLNVGGTVCFEIVLPGSRLRIQGSARVVRSADPAHEGVRGIGARFTSFLGPGAARLHEALSRQTH